MTFCEMLASGKAKNNVVTAYKLTDKYSDISRYEITVSNAGIELYTVKTAKTTWKKKFNEMVR